MGIELQLYTGAIFANINYRNMSIFDLKPFSPLFDLKRIDSFYDDNNLYFHGPLGEKPLIEYSSSLFCKNIAQNNEKEFRLSMDLPGVKHDDLNIEINDAVLRVTGCRKTTELNNGYAVKKTRFERIFKFPRERIDTDKLEANLSDGVLVIIAPKILEKKNTITVKVTNNPHTHNDEQNEEEADTKKKENSKTELEAASIKYDDADAKKK